ncbi:MFS transporter [Cellulomonas marina]|uniref:Drug resistance transporter, EmrB/QacA subfamily n=1 Tax=Cellulomonas marina TaxID=988821 RepID=A0A1I0Y3A2_9CELL|nr:MFS transporter [Cellulomonas marina]GIG29773.1 MFS transporter [Cellulomonas marina]SFB07825.1 drug resistance transporter, EmrB/QacA subfamily [Cellulomonas marina]
MSGERATTGDAAGTGRPADAGPETGAGPEGGADDGQDPRRWKALSVCLTAGFMTLLDVSIVNVALPSIRDALDASDAALQWVVSGYALTFGLVLVAAGRLGDARGRRSVFVLGVAVFTVASLGAGLAQSAAWLVVARLVQGVGGGIINPQVSGLIQQLFRGAERGRAFGRLGTVIGISTAIGPVLGGALIALLGPEQGWRWIFLVNLPVGALAIALSLRYLGRRTDPGPVSDLDPVGALLLGGGVVGLLWPLVSEEWEAVDLALLAGGVVLLVAFVLWERRVTARGRTPMVRLDLFRTPGYTPGAVLALTYFSGFTGIFFVLTLYFQNGLGYSPLQAGVAITPFAVGSAVMSTVGGRLVARHGRRVVVAGLVLVVAGLAVTDVVVAVAGTSRATGWYLVAPLLVAGLGSGLVISPNQTITLAQVPVAQAGAAGGVLQTGQRLGTAAGIALVGALYFSGSAGGDQATGAAHGLRATLALTALALVVGLVDLRRRREPSEPTGARGTPRAAGGAGR